MFTNLLLIILLLGSEHGSRLIFQTNEGQAPADARYLLETDTYHLQFKRGEVVFNIGDKALRIQFEGPLMKRIPTGSARLDGLVRYVNAGEDHQKPGIPIFASVKYESLYSGIDLTCFGRNERLKCDFVVAPNADPGQIRISIDGADSVTMDDTGTLSLKFAGRTLHIHKPDALQLGHGQRNNVDAGFQITDGRTHEIGLVVGKYDHSAPLIIDTEY